MSSDGAGFDEFYKDLKETEKADAKLTPKQQIDRLLRPGHTYRNLNPFDVLMVEPETPLEDVRKKYRKMSILVHPDKNPDDRERAQVAFDALRKANSMLDDERTRKSCLEIVEEARGRTNTNLEEKRRLRRKEAAARGLPLSGDHIKIEEDDPEKYKEAVAILTTKLFADLERKRRLMEDKISEDAQKKREAELEAEERKQIEKEFNKNWEESRQGRVNSWLSFTGKVPAASGEAAAPAAPPAPPTTARVEGAFGAAPLPQMPAQSRDLGASAAVKVKKKKEKRFSPMGFRPPKHKPESR